MSEGKYISPYMDLIELINKYFGQKGHRPGDTSPMYPGQLTTGQSPMMEMVRSLLQQRSGGGGPASYGATSDFINMYRNPFPGGVYNPFTGQIGQSPFRPMGQGNGMGPGPGMGMPPIGMGGGMGMGMGGGGGMGPGSGGYQQPPPQWTMGLGGGGQRPY